MSSGRVLKVTPPRVVPSVASRVRRALSRLDCACVRLLVAVCTALCAFRTVSAVAFPATCCACATVSCRCRSSRVRPASVMSCVASAAEKYACATFSRVLRFASRRFACASARLRSDARRLPCELDQGSRPRLTFAPAVPDRLLLTAALVPSLAVLVGPA